MNAEIERLEKELYELKQRLSEARRNAPREEVADYPFVTSTGETRLSELFGDKDDLIVVHNMGKSCSYCTLWADGFNGFLPHLENRAAFVVVSPDDPETQSAFANGRGWNFRMVSDSAGEFTTDMGYLRDGHVWPGLSAFRRENGKIYRTGNATLGPLDDFCSVWHLFDLLQGGPNGWQPQFKNS